MAHDSTERENTDLRSTSPAGSRAFLVLAVASTLLILYGTAFPFDLRFGEGALQRGWEQAYPLPWQGQEDGRPSLADLVANVMLFLPWGMWVAADAARRGRALRPTLLITGALGVALSIAVEFVQLFSPTRLPAGSDVVANGLGALLGAWAGWTLAGPVLERHARRWKEGGRRDPLGRGVWVMVALVLLAAVAPFQPVLKARHLAGALESVRLLPLVDLLGGGASSVEGLHRLSEVLWWSLAAGVIATARRASGRPSVEVGTIAATVGLALGVESLQFLFVGPTSDATSVVMSFLGGLLAVAVLRVGAVASARRRVIVALVAWSSAIAVGQLADAPTAGGDGGLAGLVPFWSVLREARVWALVEALSRALHFLPLGVGIFLLSPAMRPWQGATIAAVAVAALEVLTSAMAGRGMDSTDAVLAAMGVGLALRVLQELESTVGLDIAPSQRRC